MLCEGMEEAVGYRTAAQVLSGDVVCRRVGRSALSSAGVRKCVRRADAIGEERDDENATSGDVCCWAGLGLGFGGTVNTETVPVGNAADTRYNSSGYGAEFLIVEC